MATSRASPSMSRSSRPRAETTAMLTRGPNSTRGVVGGASRRYAASVSLSPATTMPSTSSASGRSMATVPPLQEARATAAASSGDVSSSDSTKRSTNAPPELGRLTMTAFRVQSAASIASTGPVKMLPDTTSSSTPSGSGRRTASAVPRVFDNCSVLRADAAAGSSRVTNRSSAHSIMGRLKPISLLES